MSDTQLLYRSCARLCLGGETLHPLTDVLDVEVGHVVAGLAHRLAELPRLTGQGEQIDRLAADDGGVVLERASTDDEDAPRLDEDDGPNRLPGTASRERSVDVVRVSDPGQGHHR